MIRFGTNPIAWSNDDDLSLGGHIPLDQCLREAGEIGFDGIEMGHKFPREAEALKAALAPSGLALVSGWYSLNLLARSVDEEKRAIRPHLDLLKALGCSVCIVAETSNAIHGAASTPLGERPVLAAADWPDFAAKVSEIGANVGERGLDMVYHHHIGTVVQTGEEIDRLMELTGEPVKLLLDTGHAFFAGADPEALARDYMVRVRHIHCKDIRPAVMGRVGPERLSFLQAVRDGVFTVPGDPEGSVDFLPVLKIAAANGYDGWLVIEAEQDPEVRDPVEYQSLGLRTLRALAVEAGLTAGGG